MTEQELMLTSILGCRRVDLYVDKHPLSNGQARRFEAIKKRRQEGEPLQYILGSCEFMGLELSVDERVLIPRPETEILVEEALKIYRDRMSGHCRILELGTGSGNIAIALAKNLPQSRVTTVDISLEALECARFNAKKHGVLEQIHFLQSGMIPFLRDREPAMFDFIVSNPPYIALSGLNNLPADVRREPPAALEGGKDGLFFIRGIMAHSHRLLRQGGFLCLEIGDGHRKAVEKIFKENPFYTRVDFKKDYAGTDRIVVIER